MTCMGGWHVCVQDVVCADNFSMSNHNDDYWTGMFDIKVMKS